MALLRERSIPAVVRPPELSPRRPSGRTTTGYFVDKMPWYRKVKITVWIA